MNRCIWLTLFLLPCYHASSDVKYECGSHGKFEYCIDGIPGCVVGCHCHPGYYFDTDTKICEPNTKLTQDYRRHYLPEPTRIPVHSHVMSAENQLVSTNNPVDDKIDEIAKDAGDLGDWLYNQFFKTIENQVINQTDEHDQMLTRRSGSVSIKSKPRKKHRKYLRKSDKRRKYKKSGLKKKLLRITEDDSLFDSSSSATSDESSSSSSDTDSRERDRSDVDKNKDHDHKKILIYNKKPKPPLPSFIFLPNMDTPFYPPIGLPPPPALPMYPVVPVPPVGPIYSFAPGTTPNCDEGSKSPTPTQSSTAVVTTMPTTKTSVLSTTTLDPKLTTTTQRIESNESTPSSDQLTDLENETKPKERSGTNSKKKRRLQYKHNKLRGPQKKLIQKIKENLKKRNQILPINHFIDQYQDINEPVLDGNYPPNYPIFYKKQDENFEDGTPMEDVDFKYITELIHRAKNNNTKRVQKLPSNDIFVGVPEQTSGRRNNYYNTDIHQDAHQSNLRPMAAEDRKSLPRPLDSDDSYYTNLGRQIASMIRKIDYHGKRQLNIEIERSNPSTTIQPFFNGNSYPSRSYWDRYIRSLEKKNPAYSKELGYLKNSNENLINIENKVELAVSTVLPLSLPELENLINGIKYRLNQSKDQNMNIDQKPTGDQFGYKSIQKPKSYRKDEIAMQSGDTSQAPEQNVPYKNLRINLYNELINYFATKAPLSDTTRYKTFMPEKFVITPTRRFLNDSVLKSPLLGHLQFLNNIQNLSVKQMTKNPGYPLNPVYPTKLNHKNSNYHSGNNLNQYLHQKSSYPFYFLDNARKFNQLPINSAKPSYFHHEFHHFDYFDK